MTFETGSPARSSLRGSPLATAADLPSIGLPSAHLGLLELFDERDGRGLARVGVRRGEVPEVLEHVRGNLEPRHDVHGGACSAPVSEWRRRRGRLKKKQNAGGVRVAFICISCPNIQTRRRSIIIAYAILSTLSILCAPLSPDRPSSSADLAAWYHPDGHLFAIILSSCHVLSSCTPATR